MGKMKKIAPFILGILMIWSCSKNDDPQVTGILTGSILEATGSTPLSEARIIVFNADSNEPVGEILTSGEDGKFTAELNPGNYYLRISRQGYFDSPPKGISAVPFTISVGETEEKIIEVYPNDLNDLGIFSGRVTEGGNAVPGVLVVAVQTTGDAGFSSITDQNGEYVIYNIPANTYKVKGWISGFNSDEINTTVTSGLETSNVDISLTSGVSNTFSGQIRNLAAENKDVDIALIHFNTHETIPGLTTHSLNQAYSISAIPDGIYLARATFENDVRVMDPDRIAKFGEPIVTISGGNSIDLQFDITGSVSIVSPSNQPGTNIPSEITNQNPTFEWTPYASTSDYTIEVMESNGNVIWGGFDNSGNLTQKNIVIPSGQTSIEFNADGKASIPTLEIGKVYRWRIFASKNDVNSDTGWTLISASEDQTGLIKVIE